MRNALCAIAVLALLTYAGDEAEPEQAKAEVLRRVRRMTLKQHAELVMELRAELDKRLLAPAQRWQAKFPGGNDSGVARILNRGRFEGKTLVRGGGAYFSFSTRSNDYNREPDLGLQHWRFTSGFAGGDYGLVREVGADSLDKVTVTHVPELLRKEPNDFYASGREYQMNARRRQIQPGPAGPLPDPAPAAEVGKVYVIRSVRWRESDLLAAFEVLEKDEYGITFAWKVLKRLPNPGRRR